jgi:hypothetical protein
MHAAATVRTAFRWGSRKLDGARPFGTAAPISLGNLGDSILISNEQDVLAALERGAGATDVATVSLSQISRQNILDRARSALTHKWRLASMNFERAGLPNVCDPPTNVWRRPPRLDSLRDSDVLAIPYRWGGYFQTLDTYMRDLDSGRLAGDVCTCRNADCVSPVATGLDCSGFVSFAWRTGNYFTTRGLPNSAVSQPVDWDNIQPGDIVNRSGSHVRLVERVQQSPRGIQITVIESAANESCGGVCRRTYLQADLELQGYKPLQRNNISGD